MLPKNTIIYSHLRQSAAAGRQDGTQLDMITAERQLNRKQIVDK
ncbi:MAG: hypothetical protein [Olavius algarvensis Delta 4 endosymbiont]|nr:MAG: hypothetical protein [Olavius algarvensis Delta 4 endosymbiont]